jgi:hypothetical protein
MAVLYKADGTIETVEPASGKKFTNEEVWEIIGGWYEVVPIPDNSGKLLVDEEGLLKGLPANKNASTLVNIPIVGPALWTKGEGFGS